MSKYQADLAAGSLMLPESRRVAALLLRAPTDAEWAHAVKVENILQKAAPSTAVRQARLIRFRLDPMGPAAWALVNAGDQEVASQTLFAAAMLHSQLLADFVRSVVVGHHRRLETQLHPREWDGFLADCAARDPSVEQWTTDASWIQGGTALAVRTYGAIWKVPFVHGRPVPAATKLLCSLAGLGPQGEGLAWVTGDLYALTSEKLFRTEASIALVRCAE